jgi:hypothetical protein
LIEPYGSTALAREVLRVQPCHAAGFDGNNFTCGETILQSAGRSGVEMSITTPDLTAPELPSGGNPLTRLQVNARSLGKVPLMIPFVASRSRHALTLV